MPAMLLPDNLVTVSEKLNRLDARRNRMIYLLKFGRFNLPFVSRQAMDSALFHIRDLTTLRSHTEYDSDHVLASKDVVLQKSESTKYFASHWFAFWLLTKDVLRLDDCIVCTGRRQIQVEKEELPVESLVKMVLFKDSPMDQKRAKQWDLGGSALKLNKLTMFVWSGFGCIEPALNINAESLEFTISWPQAFSTTIAPKLSSHIVADRIKDFRLVINHITFVAEMDLDKFHDQLCSLVHNILECCHKLEKMTIEFNFDGFGYIEFDIYVQWLKLLNEMMKNGSLMSLIETHGCELIIATRAGFQGGKVNDAIQSGHEVMKMGERFNIEQDRVISREVKLNEKFAVRHALCQVIIY